MKYLLDNVAAGINSIFVSGILANLRSGREKAWALILNGTDIARVHIRSIVKFDKGIYNPRPRREASRKIGDW